MTTSLQALGAMSLVAMAFCSLNDGILIGLLGDPVWFSGLNIGMIIHKVTSSFAIAQVLKATHPFRGWGLAVFGAGYTLISPASFLFAQGPLARKHFPTWKKLLAFSAGLLAYVTVTSLIPMRATSSSAAEPKTA